MVGFVEVALVAFAAQLAVLPGEKVQFIIAGLSTRYDPKVVVAAAGTAFAGWTALEIWFGAAIQGVVSPVVLDGITALLFAVFAVLLVRSAPSSDGSSTTGTVQTDGGFSTDTLDIDARLPFDPHLDRFGGFLPIFAMMAAGEFGDKTQLVTIGLAVQYGAHPGIWAGEMLAIIPVSLANAYFFNRFAHHVDLRKAHFAGAALFGFFAFDTVLAVTTGFSVWELLVTTVTNAVLPLL